MNIQEFQQALDSSVELHITVVGRKTGRDHSAPVWFVREGESLFLLPVTGSKSQWFRNVQKSKKIRISSGTGSLDLAARPITELKRVGIVADKFRKKHGVADVKKYYTRFDAAVELTLH